MNSILLPLRVSHASVLADASQDPHFLSGLLYDHPLNADEAARDIETMLKLEQNGQAIVRSIAEESQVIGRIGARLRGDRWTLFYWIIPSAQQQGHGTEALRAFLDIAPRPLYAEVYEWNEKSRNLLLRGGAQKYADIYRID